MIDKTRLGQIRVRIAHGDNLHNEDATYLIETFDKLFEAAKEAKHVYDEHTRFWEPAPWVSSAVAQRAFSRWVSHHLWPLFGTAPGV